MACILVQRRLPIFAEGLSGASGLGKVGYLNYWAGVCRKRIYVEKMIGDAREYRGTHHDLELNACA